MQYLCYELGAKRGSRTLGTRAKDDSDGDAGDVAPASIKTTTMVAPSIGAGDEMHTATRF